MTRSAIESLHYPAAREPRLPLLRSRPALKWLGRLVGLLFVVVIVGLIAHKARSMDWHAVGAALLDYSAGTLLVAGLCAALAHLATASYDLIGRRYVGHELPRRQVLAIDFIAYAVSVNIGAVFGGWGLRLRLYSRRGLKLRQILRIIGLAFITNWTGFLLLLGLLLCWPLALPLQVDLWIERPLWRLLLAALLLALIGAYLLACAIGHRRGWSLRFRDVSLQLPALRLAVPQFALSSASWLLMAATLDQLLPAQVPFQQSLTVLFVACIAGALSRVPGGLGVIEASVLWLFGEQAGELNVLTAVLAYRALYYLLPLLVAALGLATLEWRARHRAAGTH